MYKRQIIYYERYVVIQPGVKAEDGVAEYDLLSEEEYLDIDVRLGVDPRKANQMVRGVVSLPHGTGKQVRVLVLCTPAVSYTHLNCFPGRLLTLIVTLVSFSGLNRMTKSAFPIIIRT